MTPPRSGIYEESSERACVIARQVDHPDADAIFLSGVGMRRVAAAGGRHRQARYLGRMAMMWNALRIAGVRHRFSGLGRLLGGDCG
jgi:maleate cis-trans isomerase